MISFVIILSQLILRDYNEIRWGMIFSSLTFITIFIFDIISFCLLDLSISISLTIILVLIIVLEHKYLPKLWKTKKIK
jgi:hypothetical protein